VPSLLKLSSLFADTYGKDWSQETEVRRQEGERDCVFRSRQGRIFNIRYSKKGRIECLECIAF